MTHSRIAGTGGCLPDRVLTNADLAATVDTTDRWIVDRTGIRQRHVAAEGETTCDLAEGAARRALEAAGVAPDRVDLVLVATTTPDRVLPSTACLLQRRLGVRGGAAFDVQAVCAGFLYGLALADQSIRCGAARTALVVGAETMSRIVDWTDRNTCVLFGDGAGAVVLEAADAPGVLSTRLHADGSYADLLTVPAGVSGHLEAVAGSTAYLQMEGGEVFKEAVNRLCGVARATLDENGVAAEDLDWLVPHQANHRILAATARKLGLPLDRVVSTVDRHANTSAASVPLALDAAVRDGRIRRGHLLLLEAFGAGFTWGAALVRY